MMQITKLAIFSNIVISLQQQQKYQQHHWDIKNQKKNKKHRSNTQKNNKNTKFTKTTQISTNAAHFIICTVVTRQIKDLKLNLINLNQMKHTFI